MPIYTNFNSNENYQITIWEITESEKELLQLLPNSIELKQALSLRKNATHRKQFLASRLALQSLGYSIEELYFTEIGAPRLKNKLFCSISHTENFAVTTVSNNRIGIDIQKINNKIIRIQQKIIHPKETFISKATNQSKALTRLWTIKEALYKIYETKELSFSSHIYSLPFQLDDTEGTGIINYLTNKEKFSLTFTPTKNFELTIAIPSISN